jgi:hypothetical protein
MSTLKLVLAATAMIVAGCSPVNTVVKQASFDLNCPREQIQVIRIDTNNYGATGCDKRASYLAGCGLFGCMAIGQSGAAAAAVVTQPHPPPPPPAHH